MITNLSYQKNNENSKGLQKDFSAGAGDSPKREKREGKERAQSKNSVNIFRPTGKAYG